MLACNNREGHARATVKHDLSAVDVEPRTPDLSSFELRPSHSRPHALDNQASFKFGNGSNDDNHGATKRRVRIYVFAEADEADVQTTEFVQNFEEVFHRAGHPVECPDQHHIESPAPGIGHKLIETRSLRFRSADRVAVFADNLVTASHCQRTQIAKLGFWMLIGTRNSDVNGGFLHLVDCSFAPFGNSLFRA